jgi:hypothetical protein
MAPGAGCSSTGVTGQTLSQALVRRLLRRVRRGRVDCCICTLRARRVHWTRKSGLRAWGTDALLYSYSTILILYHTHTLHSTILILYYTYTLPYSYSTLYATHTLPYSYSYSTHTILILYSYYTHTLPYSYSYSTLLILYSTHTLHSTLLIFYSLLYSIHKVPYSPYAALTMHSTTLSISGTGGRGRTPLPTHAARERAGKKSTRRRVGEWAPSAASVCSPYKY